MNNIEVLTVLTSIAVVLIAGLLATIISHKIRITNILILILFGLLLKQIKYQGAPVFEFSPIFLVSIAIFALVIITFNGSSRFKIKEIDAISGPSLKLVVWFLIINAVVITFFTNVLFFPKVNWEYLLISLVFALIMTGTDAGAVLHLLKDKTHKIMEILKLESIINTPIIVLLPFIILDYLTGKEGVVVDNFLSQIMPFLTQIIVGIGSGVVVGIIIFKAMKKMYDHDLSPLGIVIAALLAYILAENLNGNGVLSVATLGLFFGNIYIKNKDVLQNFSSSFSNILEIFVFVLIGFIVNVNLDWSLFLKSLILFIFLLITRWLAVNMTLNKHKYNKKQKLFMTLNMPKGIAVAAVVFSLSVLNIPAFETVINLTLLFMIYTLVLSTIVTPFADKMLKHKKEQEIKND